MPEGHVCECGQRWVYQPARWEALYTVEDLRHQQDAGAFLRGIIPSFRRERQTVSGDPAVSATSERDPAAEDRAAVFVAAPKSEGRPAQRRPRVMA